VAVPFRRLDVGRPMMVPAFAGILVADVFSLDARSRTAALLPGVF
jgi:hypothetical protein